MRKPRYTHGFVDRHGKPRFYFRREGFKQIPLPGLPWSPEFMAAYEAAMQGATAPRLEIGAGRRKPGTVNAAIVAYYTSSAFTDLALGTRQMRRAILERFREDNGDKRLATLPQKFIVHLLGKKSPAASRNWLKTLRGFLQFTVVAELRPDDPTQGIKLRRLKSPGFKTWDDEQIALYRNRHDLGTRARLALELLLNVGARRGDVVRLGRQHLRKGEFSFRTSKTGTLVDGLPLLPELAEALGAAPAEHLTFLVTERGQPFTPAGFGGWFRDRCNEAGLPNGYAAHGLRKAAATRLADLGATPHQLMAWFGWLTLKEAELYTAAANRKKLTRSAGGLITGTSIGKPE